MKIGLRGFLAILVCKLLRVFSRLLHRGGTAMPGRIAVMLCPDLLSRLSGQVRTVAVTGTNGKTTCSRMIEEAFSESGLHCLANRSGANLMSGITTEFVMNATILGHMKKDHAVIECDEAAARTVFRQLQPQVIVVTNLFRDQLDRYGEITHTLENIRAGIQDVPAAVLCLNADCSLTSSLADASLPNRIVFYGIDPNSGLREVPTALSDASHCIRCKTEYQYEYHTYAHLGGYRCPNCGYCRPKADFAVTRVLEMDEDHSRVLLRTPSGELPITVNLPASYNIYNAAAALCACESAGLCQDTCSRALASFSCGFGRMERFDLAGGTRMILVKNPAGCTQALGYLGGIDRDYILAVCLNDRGADGTDISWIWDAEFEQLCGMAAQIRKIYVSGDRGPDMLLRLKYAGLPQDCMQLIATPQALTGALSTETLPVFILPTYTAMLELRSEIIRHCGGVEFWE